MHQGKVDPGVYELPWDHQNRPKAVFTLYWTVKQNAVNCVSNRAPVHNGNASSGTIFVPEQDCSAALLKVERIVLDRFLKRSGSSLNTFVGVKIITGLLIGEFEATITGSRFNPNATQLSLFSHSFWLKVPVINFGNCGLENRLNTTMHTFPVHTVP